MFAIFCCGYPNSLDSEGYKKADLDAYDRIASLVDDSTIDEVSLEDSHLSLIHI